MKLVASLAVVAAARVELGPRPAYLVEDMEPSSLKSQLQACLDNDDTEYLHNDWSIGHRGACMQFPEHTKESYEAAATMGAGIIECDMALTSDGHLVCRHSECDLHTTTNILVTDLASKCSVPFTPYDATTGTAASASCCTSDITLAEFKTLCGKMDAKVSTATTAEEYQGGTADWRTDLYSTCGTLVSHKESIALIDAHDLKFTPELKTYAESTPMTYDQVRALVVQDYVDAGVSPSRVWLQSFNLPDVQYWIANAPTFGAQSVYLDNAYCDGTTANCPQIASFSSWKAAGINFYAPPMQMLLKVSSGYAASDLAVAAKAAGLTIITWTVERSGPLVNGGDWYYGTSNSYTNNDGDVLELLHALATDVQVAGVFSDWPATTTFYANCMCLGVESRRRSLLFGYSDSGIPAHCV